MVADDLTGACDAGAPFAARGIPSLVWLDWEQAVSLPVGLMVLSTDSRRDSRESAKDKVRAACELFCNGGAELIFKKLDSTLKGNVGAEVEAALEASGRRQAILNPAFPDMGRLVEEGWLRGPDIEPIHIPTLLGGQTTLPVVRRIGETNDPAIIVLDATTPEDLGAIARAALWMSPPPLLAGSGGLAREMAARMRPDADANGMQAPRGNRKIFYYIGSKNPVSQAQVEFLLRHREAQSLVDKVHLTPVEPGLAPDGLDQVRRALGAALVLGGGDSARAILGDLEATAIRLEGEVLPGIPWGRILGGAADGVPVVTKAGGFGTEETLVAILNFFA